MSVGEGMQMWGKGPLISVGDGIASGRVVWVATDGLWWPGRGSADTSVTTVVF
jgi:hypothetical protein